MLGILKKTNVSMREDCRTSVSANDGNILKLTKLTDDPRVTWLTLASALYTDTSVYTAWFASPVLTAPPIS